MELSVHGKQIDVGDALRTHVSDKLEDLNQKYFNHGTFATVTFSKEGHGHPKTRTHITIQMGKDLMVVADAESKDPYESFDKAAEKVGKQLRRKKRKDRDDHNRGDSTPEAELLKSERYAMVVAPEQDQGNPDDGVPHGDDPVVIAEMPHNVETMSVSEAVTRFDREGGPAFLFRNAAHDGLNIVYRRPDGNIGWIDTENFN